MAKVFINAGHGGSDPGAVANGFEEKDLNLAIATACRDELKRHGVTVGMSRSKDDDEALDEAVYECNEFAPDLAVSIHNNAGGGDGIEIYYHYKGGKCKTAATNVINEVVAIGQNSRGIKIRKNKEGRDYYGWIRRTVAPAILIECAFVDNKKDIAIIDTPAEQKAMGIAIAKGILKSLGIQWVEEKKVETKKTLYRVQVGAFSVKANADAYVKKLKADGYDAFVVEVK